MPALGGILSTDSVTEIESGAGAPGSAPAAVGNIYVDTTNDNIYGAADTAIAGDWKQLNAASGANLTWDAASQTVQSDSGTDATITWTLAQLNSSVSDATLVDLDDTQTLTNKTLTTPTITLQQSAAPTPTVEGEIHWDTDGDLIVVGNGVGQTTFTSIAAQAGWGTGPTNATTDRAYDANATTIDELADVVATIINDLLTAGVFNA